MKLRDVIKFVFWTGLIVGVVLGVLRLFLFQPWTVPDDDPALSASVAPALAGGDYVIVAHGLPRDLGKLVRCTHPNDPEQWVIGRIMGIGGDTVEMDGAKVVRNGSTVPSLHACTPATISVRHPHTDSSIELQCSVEKIENTSYMSARDPRGRMISSSVKRTVPQDMFFIVSDNRMFPNDSFTFGSVPVENCDARILFRMWSAEGFSDAENRFVWVN